MRASHTEPGTFPGVFLQPGAAEVAQGKEVMVPVGGGVFSRLGFRSGGVLESCRVARKGLCCAHLMGKVKLKTVSSWLLVWQKASVGCYPGMLPCGSVVTRAPCLISLTQFGKCDTIKQTWVKGSCIAEQIMLDE